MDHEENMLSFFLNFISTALSATFGNACIGDHEPLVMVMLRWSQCIGVTRMTVYLKGVKAFCDSALIPASSGGGAPRWNAQFARWNCLEER